MAHRIAVLTLAVLTFVVLVGLGINGDPSPAGAPAPHLPRCTEDAVHLGGSCVTIDDLPVSQLRTVAQSIAAHCPAGHAYVEAEQSDLIGYCR